MKNTIKNIVVIGASAGGYRAILSLVKGIPDNLNAAVFIVQHMPAFAKSNLTHLLSNQTSLRVVDAKNNDRIASGTIYTAPTDCHLMLEKDRVIVTKGPKENRFRPAIDTLFRSAAYEYRDRVIGVVLSGALNDGTSGMWTIKRNQGISIIQSPDDADFDSMPLSVQQYTEVDYVLPAAEIGPLLGKLTAEPILPIGDKNLYAENGDDLLRIELDIAKGGNGLELGILDKGTFTPLTCPECKGALSQFREGNLIRFRCHTGHAYTVEALMTGINEVIENKMWEVMKSLEECNLVLQQIGKRLKESGLPVKAHDYYKRATAIQQKAKKIQDAINEREEISAEL